MVVLAAMVWDRVTGYTDWTGGENQLPAAGGLSPS